MHTPLLFFYSNMNVHVTWGTEKKKSKSKNLYTKGHPIQEWMPIYFWNANITIFFSSSLAYIQGNSRKVFERCCLSSLSQYLHYISIPLHTNSCDNISLTIFMNSPVYEHGLHRVDRIGDMYCNVPWPYALVKTSQTPGQQIFFWPILKSWFKIH